MILARMNDAGDWMSPREPRVVPRHERESALFDAIRRRASLYVAARVRRLTRT